MRRSSDRGIIARHSDDEASTTATSSPHDNVFSERKLSLRRYSDPEKSAKEEISEDVGSTEMCMTREEFKKILNERKAELTEKTEKKRLVELNQIQNTRSRLGIDPLELFPKEIWAEIMAKLSPQDVLSIRKVHHVFADLSDGTLVRDILFPLVLDYKIPLIQHSSGSDLDLEQVISLRQVSKSLRESIDHWIEENIIGTMRSEMDSTGLGFKVPHIELPDLPPVLADINQFEFRRGNEDCMQMPFIQRVAAYFGPSGKTRFFRRAFEMSFVIPTHFYQILGRGQGIPEIAPHLKGLFQNYLELTNNMMKFFLDLAGKQLWLLKVDIQSMWHLEEYGVSPLQIYDLLREWLLLTPNLKWLVLSVDGLGSSLNPLEWIDNARLHIQNLPMPHLKDLERVDLSFPSSGDHASQGLFIWDAILTANRQVKHHSYDDDDLFANSIQRYMQPLVRSLALESLELESAEDFLAVSVPILQKIPCSENNWNLKRITLDINANDGGVYRIFRCLEKFPTLENLTLSIDHLKLKEEEDTSYLRLPNLKKLKVGVGPKITFTAGNECFRNFFSLHFLLHCAKLETIVWHNLMDDTSNQKRQVDLLGLSHSEIAVDFKAGIVNLTSSNVWEVFTRLKSIQVKFREETADGQRWCCRTYRDRELVHESNDDFDSDLASDSEESDA